MTISGRFMTSPAAVGENGEVELRTDDTGRLIVRTVDANGNSITTFAEDAAHTSGDRGLMLLAVRKDTAAALAGADADYIPLIVDATGRLWVNVGSFTPGTAAGDLGKAEDAAHSSSDTGVMALAVRTDIAAARAGTDGDYIPLSTDSNGLAWVRNRNDYKAVANLLAGTTITTDGTTAVAAVTGFGHYRSLILLLTVSLKTMDAGTTLDIYVQTSPDDGTTWDDIAHFAQITSAAIPNGTYVARLLNDTDAGFVDRATRDVTLAAGSIVDYFADRVRVKYVSAAFAGADTITVQVQAVAVS